MASTRVRLLQASAVVGAAGAVVGVAAVPAGATQPVTVTPASGLYDATSVSVSFESPTAWQTGVQGVALECSSPVGEAVWTSLPPQCVSLGSLTVYEAADGNIALQGQVKVHKTIAPKTGTLVCSHQCSITVGYGSSQFIGTPASVPITFK